MNHPAHSIAIDAPAKINLGLEVLRRRADGFHDINTLFAAITLADRVTIRTGEPGRIGCRVPAMPWLENDPTNLCVRAAALLRDAMGRTDLGVEIELEKRIPVGAGLGGGSSDAAAVLRGAPLLWEVAPSETMLMELGARLGSDVPFFLRGGIALGRSRGELLEPVELLPPFHLLLLFPGIHVSTPWAYRAVARIDERPATDLVSTLRRGIDDPEILRRELVNDFEAPVFHEHPVLVSLKERLYARGALYAAMSGSGSTIFGLFADHAGAEHARGEFEDMKSAVAGFLPEPTAPRALAH